MNIVVCIKQVPDIEGRVIVEKGAISVQGMVSSNVINPPDLVAVEAALQLKEQSGEGSVTLVTLGSPESEEILRAGLAMGADNAILLDDAMFAGGDSYAIAYSLAKAIDTIPHDIILCGQKADDSQSGQVSAYLARMFDFALVRGVVGVELRPEEGVLVLQSKLSKGDREVIECSLPAVLAVDNGCNTPRHATIKGVLKARKQQIDRLNAEDLGLSQQETGISGSKTRAIRISPPKPKMKGLFVPDSNLSHADKLMAIMGGGIVQKKSNFLEGNPENIAGQLLRFLQEQKIVHD
ncbi:MAG TPA: electron transfer flavoprotein subunit beta/FixA family protein [Dehalococcoidia bacterium]|nr:electron transfer flavoprotein subunit beta/FixA family protein [Dehalococcoidia bacterium]